MEREKLLLWLKEQLAEVSKNVPSDNIEKAMFASGQLDILNKLNDLI